MKFLYTMVLSLLLLSQISCNKEKLDLKPDQSLVIPSTIEDFQSLLDNTSSINSNQMGFLAELSADNYWIPYNTWNGLTPLLKYSSVWAKDPYQNASPGEWTNIYSVIYRANLVLEGIEKYSSQSSTRDYKTAKGCALFLRGWGFYQLAQVFCKPYNAATASTDLGLPLTRDTDPLSYEGRSSVAQTYDLIIGDLKESVALIDSFNTAVPFPTRPALPAVAALLCRTYMSMRQYDKALPYASMALSIQNTLMDYNALDPKSSAPIKQYHVEDLFTSSALGSAVFTNPTNCPIDTNLYKSYDANDLRKVIFFTKNTSNGNMQFKGQYSGTSLAMYEGIATDEVYLNRAECYARAGDITNAMKDLNALMVKRWKNDGSFVPFSAGTPEEALSIILRERRKELIYRGLRWTDLRRLNLDGANITLTRVYNGVTYTLLPNSPNYVLPIPKSETDFNPMPQNERE